MRALLPFSRKQTAVQAIEPVLNLAKAPAPWWGTFLMDEGQSRFFKIGSLVLCVDRYNQAWRMTTYREGEQPLNNFAAQASNQIILKPALPDRSLLVQLERPFYIPVGKTLVLYVSSPVWMRIAVGEPPVLLAEVAENILPDTWFGKTTLEGELCYAGELNSALHIEDLLHDMNRVITPVSIENHSKDTLLLQGLKIPLPYLSIYSDLSNQLWTEQLNIYQETSNDIQIHVVKGAPLMLKDTHLLCHARIDYKPGLKSLLSPFIMWK